MWHVDGGSKAHGLVLLACALLISPIAAANFEGVLQNVQTDGCLTVEGASTALGANVAQWACVPNDTSQTVEFLPVDNQAHIFRLRFKHSGHCLQVAGSSQSNGATLEQRSCSTSVVAQRFRFMAGTYGEDYEIIAEHSLKNVEVESNSTANGVDIVQNPADGSDLQRWRMTSSDIRDPAVYGQWSPVMPWPHIPVSIANLPDGRILTWSGSEQETWPGTEQTWYLAIARS